MLRSILARRRILITALIAALAFASGAAVVGYAEGIPAVIYACVNNGSGTIHIVTATGTCSSNEMRLNWNQQGPAGPPGPPGGSGSGATGTVIGYLGKVVGNNPDYSAIFGPVAGATAYLSGTEITATTDANGRFELKNVPVGPTWTIMIASQETFPNTPPVSQLDNCLSFIPGVHLTQVGQVLEFPGYQIESGCLPTVQR